MAKLETEDYLILGASLAAIGASFKMHQDSEKFRKDCSTIQMKMTRIDDQLTLMNMRISEGNDYIKKWRRLNGKR